jgi:hypothetical protein
MPAAISITNIFALSPLDLNRSTSEHRAPWARAVLFHAPILLELSIRLDLLS